MTNDAAQAAATEPAAMQTPRPEQVASGASGITDEQHSALVASLRGKHIMFYDGHCKYCHMMAQMCMKGDRDHMVRFAHFQSDFARRELLPRGGDIDNPLKMWLIGSFGTDKEVLLCGPDAALYIQQRIGGFPRFMALATQWWPTPMRHGMYKFVGKRKDKWFGTFDQCKVPSAEQKSWFLS